MNKSEFLDEMRMEVGRAPDDAVSLHDFYVKVLKTFEYKWNFCEMTAIYENNWDHFQVITLHEKEQEKVVTLQESPVIHCAIHGKTTSYFTIDSTYLFVPFYLSSLLKGILVLKVRPERYVMQEEDVTFLNEVSRFLGAASADFLT
ncbi:hypothetical protein [Alteribacillus bidgolensis]|uniref:Uncharacterized protein n=1 Tax=Alteribacillus bidgolensis TaxID=930129 RepID=A0A1G8G304_9BACI|nr:hypothetical protein [Alteribacillus bidgolensis]SDH88680.1 hypothetical protein SAMN05216352_103199 [Alteribacillus bidgolensis]